MLPHEGLTRAGQGPPLLATLRSTTQKPAVTNGFRNAPGGMAFQPCHLRQAREIEPWTQYLTVTQASSTLSGVAEDPTPV
jgi:hypothetical protein